MRGVRGPPGERGRARYGMGQAGPLPRAPLSPGDLKESGASIPTEGTHGEPG